MPTPTHTNRLAHETSPYLLQHAHNPVDWYAWGDAAFDAARSQNKPIFLSIGYATCYWCHVMERESFEDDATAQYMNEHFINIKVDREERPDVDDIYMAAVQALNRGQGGWPMSVFLEPQSLKPFFAGTYYPPGSPDAPAAAQARPTFPDLLRFIEDVWQNRRDDVIQQADQIAAFLGERLSGSAEHKPLDGEIINRAIGDLMRSYDETHGGFGSAPKFPQPVFLDLLIDTAWSDENVRHAVGHTLTRMAIGGMYDQVGGGFHRYSVDAKWLVPHFEKMLYDNAQLLSTYSRAYALTRDPFYARTIRRTAEYVLREMTADGGAFYSAQDAEVDAREGLSYLWTADDVREALAAAGFSDDDVTFALDVYGLSRGTNFQDPHHPSDPPRNVLFLVDTPHALAAARDMSLDDLFAALDRINAALLDVRDKRKQAATDDKILTGWNGLMIAGLTDAGRALDEPRYIDAASKAALFLMEQHRSNRYGLLRSSRNGEAGAPAVLEDDALLAHGLLTLARATKRDEWSEAAMMFIDEAHKRYWNDDGGGYFDTRPDQADLFVRTRNLYDGAVPCGNAVMAMNLLDLAEQTGRDAYIDDAMATLASMSSRLHEHPPSLALGLRALHRAMDGHPEPAASLARPAPADGGAAGGDAPVQITLEPNSITFNERGDAEVMLTIDVAGDHHINAHEPGTADVQPLLFTCETRGIEIEPHYPVGDVYDGPAAGGQRIRVHTGTTRIPITLRSRDRDVPDTIEIAVTYQPCTDTTCLRPQTARLTVRTG